MYYSAGIHGGLYSSGRGVAVFLREYKDLGHEVLPFRIDVPIPEFVFHRSRKSREVDNVVRPLYHQRPGIWAVQQTDGT